MTELPGALFLYINEIRNIPILTENEEKDLVIRLRNGDEEAKRLLIRSCLRLVVAIAKRFTNSNLELLDIIQEGNVGLTEAANDFITKEGYRFKSYADDAVRHQIIDAIRAKPKLKTVSLFKDHKSHEYEDTDFTLEELLPDSNAVDPQTAVEANEFNEEVIEVIQTLPKQEAVRMIVGGMSGYELPKSLREEFSESKRILSHPSRKLTNFSDV